MMIENIIYNVKMWVIRKLCVLCHWLMGKDYPRTIQDQKQGWQFNNRWKPETLGEVEERQE
jgi:hypothetical protein